MPTQKKKKNTEEKENRYVRKIDEKIIEQIADVVRAGNYIDVAAACFGIDKSTLFDWLRRGAREQRRLESDPNAKPLESEKIYVKLSNAIKRAVADSERRDLATIEKAAETQWQAAAWRLERRFPERWAKKDNFNTSGTNEVNIRIIKDDTGEGSPPVDSERESDTEDL